MYSNLSLKNNEDEQSPGNSNQITNILQKTNIKSQNNSPSKNVSKKSNKKSKQNINNNIDDKNDSNETVKSSKNLNIDINYVDIIKNYKFCITKDDFYKCYRDNRNKYKDSNK